MKAMPKIMKFMTPNPHTVNAHLTLAQAEKMMLEHRIRHLPVLDGGRLIGVLSDRDIKMVSSFKDVDPNKVTVEDACTFDPITVSPEAPLDEVVLMMSEKRIGSVLVVDNHKLVGIYTWVDALRAMHEILNQRFHP
ncbi:MAG: CBS domain-containing protein [Bdellovibrionaceae bacterium]|nr:CBS domain-containing protein [Pseudobdellovibrionaceae bacterium]MDW8189645.1 CBS domain-containing protein [Pseudobdellovibrionaceae bacterium]